MSIGLTAGNLASMTYNSYALANSARYSAYNGDNSDASSKYYNVSNLSNALSGTKKAVSSVNLNGITNVCSYAKSAYKLSQTPEYSSISDAVSNTSTPNGSLSNYTSFLYTAQKLGVSTNANINLYGVVSAQKLANSDYMASQLSELFGEASSGTLGSYRAYSSSSNYSVGALLDTEA